MKFDYGKFQTFIFCLYLISGETKFLFVYYNVPIDITIVAAILVVVDLLYNLTSKQIRLKLDADKVFFITLLFLFYMTMVLTLSYTHSETFGFIKTLLFSLTFLAFIYPLFIRKFHIDLFVKILLYTTIPAALWFIAVKHLYWTGYKDQIGEHFEPLLGAYIGLSINIVFLVFYYTIINKKLKLVLGLLILILALGSRGAFLFSLLIVIAFKYKDIITAISRPRLSARVSKGTIAFFLVVIPALYFVRDTLITGLKFGLARFQSMQNFGQDNSSNERIEFYQFSITKIFDSVNSFFFGYGVGSFGVIFNGIDSKLIPHNVFLESLFELGLLGTILLMMFTILPFFLKNRILIFRMMALFFLLDSMKSGGLHEMRYMFGIYGCLIFMEANNNGNALIKTNKI